MSLPAPYAEADDKALTEGCVSGDEDAWKVLAERHGRLIDVAIARVIDERRQGALADVPPVHARVMDALRKEQAAGLRHWAGASRLRSYLALIARRVALAHTQDDTPPATLMASLPTPDSIHLEDIALSEPLRDVSAVLDRLAPNVVALVRLRVRGLDRDAIAQTLGVGAQNVTASLERIAQRLGETHVRDTEAGVAVWRVLLDVAGTEEHVRVAIRTEDDTSFAKLRSVAEGVWRVLREKWAAPMPQPRGPVCLDDGTTAGFVDGTLRGPARARVEGHVVTCARCIDEVATLARDLVAVDVLREAEQLPHVVALAAACIATTRFRAGEDLAHTALAESPEAARDLVRLAQLGRALEGGGGERRAPSVSGVASRLPTDDEAPLMAFEALVAGEPGTAASAIDDEIARRPLGARLRLLAAAAGHDLARARALATAIRSKPHGEPGLGGDADAVLALPEGRKMPREILNDRLRDALPEAVRLAIGR